MHASVICVIGVNGANGVNIEVTSGIDVDGTGRRSDFFLSFFYILIGDCQFGQMVRYKLVSNWGGTAR